MATNRIISFRCKLCTGRRGLPAALCLLFLLLAGARSGPVCAGEHTLPWISYETAMSKGRNENKPVMLFFRTRWCYQCTEMEETVLSNSSVTPVLSEKFLLVEVDIGKETQLKEAHHITFVPTTVFLDAGGKTVLTLRGLVKKTRFLKALRYVAEGHHKRGDFMRFEESGQ